jgi:hypothetical protein
MRDKPHYSEREKDACKVRTCGKDEEIKKTKTIQG